MDAIGKNSPIAPYVKPTPIFSFYSIVDIDAGLLRYVMDNYYDRKIFDFEAIKTAPLVRMISFLYFRPCENLLSLFIKDEKYKDFIDECYYEFLETKEDEIIDYSVKTEVSRLIAEFRKSSAINPAILYYTDKQLEVLNNIEILKDIPKYHYDKVDLNKFEQFYFRHCEEYYDHDKYHDLKYKTFYFSSDMMNLHELQGDFDYEYVEDSFVNENQLNLYDIYRYDVINKDVALGIIKKEEEEGDDEDE